jgi:putative hydrolase of the HAD superfamily
MSLQALLFDLDDTLIVDQAISHHAFAQVASKAQEQHRINPGQFIDDAKAIARQRWKEGSCYAFCHSIGISAFECLWGNFLGDSSDLILLKRWAEDYRHQVFRDALAQQQKKNALFFAKELMEEFIIARRKEQRLMPKSREVVEELSKKFKLGLLTNGAPDLQREKLRASGLEDFFSAIVISGEHGIGKPKPAIFQKLLQLLSIKPEEAVMIGNSLERDIAGAQTVGIPSIWISVPGAEESADVKPDASITELKELIPLVKKF